MPFVKAGRPCRDCKSVVCYCHDESQGTPPMTNDTKAPERLVTSKCGKTIVHNGMKRFESDIEWVPYDHALALVAAAYGEVIDLCENAAPAPEWGSDTKSTYRFAGKDLARSIRKAAPADAQAALEARDKRIRKEALREVAQVARAMAIHRFEQGQEVGQDAHTGECASQKFWPDQCAKHILALIEKDKIYE